MATNITTATILVVFIVVVVYSPQSINCLKTMLFDTTKISGDLNWKKLSFRNIDSNYQLDENMLGWQEVSMQINHSDIWRVHFACELNMGPGIENIQNWLFTPLIETRDANRVTLNLTFTIRECNEFPIEFVKNNCREKFELYYEEIDTSSIEQQQQKQIDSSINKYFMSKILQLRFLDTFVSSAHSKTHSIYINQEVREIPLPNKDVTHIRFAIRDTGACISLLSVQASYTSCPAVVNHGIRFDETPTGRNLTDLVHVSGQCPAFSAESVSGQAPKAICTANGEWLITDLNLANRCLCLPGYQFFVDRCTPCQMGSYKLSKSNDERCLACPENSWSSISGATSCQCMRGYYRENESDLSSSCIAIRDIDSSSLQVALVSEERVNISIPFSPITSTNVQIDLRCFTCSPQSFYYECDKSCFVASSGPNWLTIVNKTGARSRVKIEIKQLLNAKVLSRSVVYVGLNEKPLIDGEVICEPKVTEPKNLLIESLKLPKVAQHWSKPTTCLNLSINLNQQLNSIFLEHELIEKVRSNRLAKFDIYILMVSKDYRLISVDNNEPTIKSYQHIEVADFSLDLIKSFILNSIASYSFLLCNNIDEIERVRIELGFRPNVAHDVAVVDEKEIDRFDIYSIEGKLFDMCIKNPLNSKFVRQFADLHLFDYYSNSNHSGSLMASLKNLLSERSLNPNGSSSSHVASPDFKIHFLLSITLSFFLVTAIILLALFVRRYRAKLKSVDKDYNCEKHMRKFVPKSCSSTKCITCKSQKTNSSTSSQISASTTCTMSISPSQIQNNQHHQSIENHQSNSKLNYVNSHTYEEPSKSSTSYHHE